MHEDAKTMRGMRVSVLPDNESMGIAAGRDAACLFREGAADDAGEVAAIFAAAPSQDTFLARLCEEPGIDWKRVRAFHLDEYLDLERGHPNTFEKYLNEHLFDRVPIPRGNILFFKDFQGDAARVAAQYATGLREGVSRVKANGGRYVACIGIGVNGHMAFNDPGTAVWTPEWTCAVTIDETSARQQYDDYRDHPDPEARYAALADVPRRALTVTCAGILAADVILCMVPGKQKSAAVQRVLEGPITADVPASLLRLHGDVRLYLDADAACALRQQPIADS